MIYTKEVFAKYTDPETFARIKEMDTVAEMWQHCIENYGEKTAIVDDGKSYTFAEVEEDTAFLRGALVEKGVKQGDVVGVFSVNSYDFVKAYLAAVTLGAMAVIIPAHLPEQAIFGLAMNFKMKALITCPSLDEKTAFAKEHGAQAAFLLTTDKGAEKAPICTSVKKEHPAVVMFTGGTTGKSKGALLSNGAVMQGTVNGCYGIKEIFDQRYLLILPLSHVFGLIRNLMSSLYTGSALFICRNNKDMFRDIAMFRPTVLVMVPALAEMALTLSKKFKKNMLGEDLKTIIAGAAMVPPYLVNEYHKMGIDLFPGYGLTESANLVSGNPESLKKPESVGIPFPNQELKVVDGELWIKGANMMMGYVGEAENAYEDGWFKTGDLVRFDEDGFLYITGRIKEIIVLPNGENISPAEVEAYFNELTCVQDSQVFEDVNAAGQHILALEVVPRMTELQGIEDVGKYVIGELEKVNASLPSFMQVSKMAIRTEDFERTPSMKIKRYKFGEKK